MPEDAESAPAVDDAVSDVLADRLAARLAPGLSHVVAQRLLDSPRLGERTRAWARDGALSTADLPADDRAIVTAGNDGLRRLSGLCGAVWNAHRVRGLVMARDLQAFIDTHGPEARDAAMRYAHLSPESEAAGDQSLDEAVSRDGRACLSAWIGTLPALVAQSLRMSLPHEMETDPDETHGAHGPGIVRAVAHSYGTTAPIADEAQPA